MSVSELSDRARVQLAELAVRYSLTDRSVQALTGLVKLLTVDAAAPTSVRGERAVLDDHLADSLVALELEQVRSAGTIADIGSGAGLPGLALAAALPQARVSVVESNARKCAFLERAAAAGGLDNVQVINARAELWRDGAGQADLVTARALAALPVVAEYAAPLLQIGGTLVVWRGARDFEEETAAAAAGRELGLDAAEPLRVSPYPGARHRYLHMMVKVSPTPERFPRRPGVAAKRPLGGWRQARRS